MIAPAPGDRFDRRQWQALTRAYLVMDYATLLGVHGRAERRAGIVNLLTLAFVGVMSSLGPTLIVLLMTDRFTAATVLCTSLGLTTAAIVLGQASSLASPEDLEIVASRPVSSRTYFAVRATGLLINTACVLGLTGALPVLAFLVRSGSIATTVAAAVACATLALTVALGVLVVHGSLIRIVSTARLNAALAWVNLVMMLTVSGAYLLGFSQLVDRTTGLPGNVDFTIDKGVGTLLYPPAWFASYVEAASGSAGRIDMVGILLSMAALGVCALALRGGLTASYAARMAEPAIERQGQAPAAPAMALLSGEARVVLLLLRAQLATDMGMRTALIMSVCMFLLFLVFSAANDLPRDPFEPDASGVGSSSFGLFGLLLIGPMLYQSMLPSAASAAAWLWFSTPADHVKAIRATGMSLFALVLVPLLLVMASFLTYAYGDAGHAVAQTAVAGAIAFVMLQLSILGRPRLPFSLSPGSRRAFGGGGLMMTMMLSMPPLVVLNVLVCRSYPRVAAALVMLAVMMVALDRLIRWRVANRPDLLEWAS